MPEEQLKKILNFHWKGFMEYDELTDVDKHDHKKAYSIQELYNALKEAYNLGIEIAADYAQAECQEVDDPVVGIYQDAFVIRESILEHKIQ